MKLNRECKRELVATVIYNIMTVLILLTLKYFKLFDLMGVKPELEIFIWLIAGVGILASIISVTWSYAAIYKR